MIDRERLVELLRKDNCCSDNDCNKCLSNIHCYPKTVADLILADGWMRSQGETNMFKFFSNTVVSYLEKDLNDFIKSTNYSIINIFYNAVVIDGEIVHSVLIHYNIPAEKAEKALRGGERDGL